MVTVCYGNHYIFILYRGGFTLLGCYWLESMVNRSRIIEEAPYNYIRNLYTPSFIKITVDWEKLVAPNLLTTQNETSTVLQMWLDRFKKVLTSCYKIEDKVIVIHRRMYNIYYAYLCLLCQDILLLTSQMYVMLFVSISWIWKMNPFHNSTCSLFDLFSAASLRSTLYSHLSLDTEESFHSVRFGGARGSSG